MTVIKRSSESTKKDLINAVYRFVELLVEQEEDQEAIDALRSAAKQLEHAARQSPEEKVAAESIIDAFEGDHELIAYTIQRNSSTWTEIEELSNISARVLSLARRLR